MRIESKYLLFFILLIIQLISFGQYKYSGIISDKKTRQPLSFVNIVYSNPNRHGTTSDLDGRFQIESKTKISSLKFSFMGYKNETIDISTLQQNIPIEVNLETQSYNLPEAKVYAKENPAHRVIKKAVQNRKKNNPKSLQTFKYETYSKMFFTFDLLFYQNGDTLTSLEVELSDTLTKRDSAIVETNDLINSQYLFLMESVTQKKYKRPGKIHEEVIASRVSGFKNPAFTLIGSQLQDFSIYSDYISIGGMKYLSPLAKNSINKYLFLIEDTLLSHNSDTSYTLSYRPRKNMNFEGLKGIIHINTKGYAVENFSTEPIDQDLYSITVRQKYEFTQDSAWFPTQLDADIIYKNLLGEDMANTIDKKPDNISIYGKAKTYIKKIELNPEIKNKDFSYIALEYDEKANIKDSLFWALHRVDPISLKEQNTYHIIDSLGQKMKFEKYLKLITYLVKGEFPLGPISVRIDQLFGYNIAEGFRTGLGLTTNDKLFKFMKFGGYGAYGFTDEKFKYGVNLKFNLRDYYDSNVEIKYQNDVSELAGFNFLETKGFLDPSTYRDFLVNKITYQESAEIAVEARFLYYLKAKAYGKFSSINTYEPSYKLNTDEGIISDFKLPEVGLQIRYAYQEHYIKTPLGIQAIKSDYPVLFFNIEKTIPFEDYKIDYTKIWAKVEKNFTIRNVGKSSISLQSGYAFGDIPYFKLYNGHGSYYPFTILANNSFGAMRLNEFISDRFVYFFYRHSFGKLLFKSKYFNPEFIIAHNMGWGNLSNPEQQLGVSLNTMKMGYVESGLIIDNIFTLNYAQYGFGVFYRYGHYQLPKTIDNFGFKINFKYAFG